MLCDSCLVGLVIVNWEDLHQAGLAVNLHVYVVLVVLLPRGNTRHQHGQKPTKYSWHTMQIVDAACVSNLELSNQVWRYVFVPNCGQSTSNCTCNHCAEWGDDHVSSCSNSNPSS